MEAQRLPDGRVRFLASIAGFDLLVALLAEAKSELWNKEEEFPERVGITSEEYGSLQDELRLVRYGPLGYPRPRDSQTRRALGTHRAEENWHRVGQSAQDGGRGPGWPRIAPSGRCTFVHYTGKCVSLHFLANRKRAFQ
jgi:hypothetical protein